MDLSNFSVGVCSRTVSKNQYVVDRLEYLFGDVRINDNGSVLQGDSLIEFADKRDFLIVGLESIDENFLKRSRNLKGISKYGVGLNNIDFKSCKIFGIKVVYSEGVNKRSVSELAISQIIHLLRRVDVGRENISNGFMEQVQGRELSHVKLGIIGFGNIGQDLAKLLKIWGTE